MPIYKIEANRKTLTKFEPQSFGVDNPESLLQDWIEHNSSILLGGKKLLIIGREAGCEAGPIDLLAVNNDGDVVIVELKKGITPRDVIAQALDYLSAVESWGQSELDAAATKYFRESNAPYTSLSDAFEEEFPETLDFESDEAKTKLPPFDTKQHIFIVVQEISAPIVRMSNFLCRKGLSIYCLEFKYHKTDKGEELIDVITKVEPPQLPIGQTPRAPKIDEQTFLSICNERTKQLYHRLKGLSDRQGFQISFGSAGFGYRHKFKSTLHTIFALFPGHIQIWMGPEYPPQFVDEETYKEFWARISQIQAFQGKLDKKNPQTNINEQDWIEKDVDTFIAAIELLGSKFKE